MVDNPQFDESEVKDTQPPNMAWVWGVIVVGVIVAVIIYAYFG